MAVIGCTAHTSQILLSIIADAPFHNIDSSLSVDCQQGTLWSDWKDDPCEFIACRCCELPFKVMQTISTKYINFFFRKKVLRGRSLVLLNEENMPKKEKKNGLKYS